MHVNIFSINKKNSQDEKKKNHPWFYIYICIDIHHPMSIEVSTMNIETYVNADTDAAQIADTNAVRRKYIVLLFIFWGDSLGLFCKQCE